MTRPSMFVPEVGGLRIMRWTEVVLPTGLDRLIAEAEREGYAWIGTFRAEWEARPYLAAGEALFVATDGAGPVAMAAVGTNLRAEEPAAGRLKYIYVGQGARGRGLLRALVELCLARADTRFRQLTLHTGNPVAARVYESYGFRPTTEHGHSTHVREIAYPAAATASGTS